MEQIYIFHLDYYEQSAQTPLQLKGHNLPFRHKEIVIDVLATDYDSALSQAKDEYRRRNYSIDSTAPIRVIHWENG